MTQLNSLEANVLSCLQAEFPLVERPFAEMAAKLGLNETGLINEIATLKERGLLREISPVVNPQSLGYRTTLVAMKVPELLIESAEECLAGQSGVSHAYIRENELNLWVTLAIAEHRDMPDAVSELGKSCGAEIALSLPSIKTYKLKALFGRLGTDEPDAVPTVFTEPPALSKAERRVINIVQRNLPLEPEPFRLMAKEAGLNTAEFLALINTLKTKGIIRRYGASINHRKAGYSSNAMACWRIDLDKLDDMGETMASRREVSHCYSRRSDSIWPYNLYAMIHSSSREDCARVAAQAAATQDIQEPILLYSSRELKKARNFYLA